MNNYLICFYILQQCLYESLEEDIVVLLNKLSPELWEDEIPGDGALFDEWKSIIDDEKMTEKQIQSSLVEHIENLGLDIAKTIGILKGDSFSYYLLQARESAEEYLSEINDTSKTEE